MKISNLPYTVGKVFKRPFQWYVEVRGLWEDREGADEGTQIIYGNWARMANYKRDI